MLRQCRGEHPAQVEVEVRGILEEVRFDLSYEGWVRLLRVDLGQMGISGRKNIAWFLHSKSISKNFVHSHLIRPGEAFLSFSEMRWVMDREGEAWKWGFDGTNNGKAL